MAHLGGKKQKAQKPHTQIPRDASEGDNKETTNTEVTELVGDFHF